MCCDDAATGKQQCSHMLMKQQSCFLKLNNDNHVQLSAAETMQLNTPGQCNMVGTDAY